MPGKRITLQQRTIFMTERQKGKTQRVAAAIAGFSERSARNLHKPRKSRDYRTRKDPLAGVWEEFFLPKLRKDSELQAITLLEELQDIRPGEFPSSLLRTLQRRIRRWRAENGPEKEVYFPQKPEPGWQAISDFTVADELNVTIRGKQLDHRLYHFRLPYSGWEAAKVILGGESFTAISEGLQDALWQLGGVTKTHRTDSLSAAYKNEKKQDDFTESYDELCQHYGMEPTRNNRGQAHENGSIEAANGHLKRKIDQALRIRESRDFDSLQSYRELIAKVIHRHNQHRVKKLEIEKATLKPLPAFRSRDYNVERAKVTKNSTFQLRSVIYSAPSRLIGMTLKIHLYDDRLDCFLGSDKVYSTKRLCRNKKKVRSIDFHHVIGTLVRKPQAFRRYAYRDALFPSPIFQQAWELLDKELAGHEACREYVKILAKAAEDLQSVEAYLAKRLGQEKLPRSKDLRQANITHPALEDHTPELESYDQLLVGGGQ